MDRKQKEQLRFLLKARKRAEKVLAQRREAEQQKLDLKRRKEASQELKQQYTEELTALARQSGILVQMEQAAQARSGSLEQEVSYYIYYGLSSSSFQNALGITQRGELRASHLALVITWSGGAADGEQSLMQAEARVHKNGQITFHNSILPVPPLIWRMAPRVLEFMWAQALAHPRKAAG